MDRIREAVREAGIFVVLGYSERYNGSIYIARVYISLILETPCWGNSRGLTTILHSFGDHSGTIVHHRRKIKPTHVERAYYGDGQSDSLTTTVQTPFGNVSGLNCWEQSQPLLRYYTCWQDPDIHASSWPLIWDMPPNGAPWQWHITPDGCSRFSQVLAMEGACFVVVATQILTEKNRKKCLLEGYEYARTPGGGFSMIYGPDGAELVRSLASGEEGILYADVDVSRRALAKHNLDTVGHYSRPDLLSLRVTKYPGTQVRFLE